MGKFLVCTVTKVAQWIECKKIRRIKKRDKKMEAW